jgi:hypothetical protein
VFGFAKVRYRGLKKNAHRLLVTCAQLPTPPLADEISIPFLPAPAPCSDVP